jgi:hypothetical protein
MVRPCIFMLSTPDGSGHRQVDYVSEICFSEYGNYSIYRVNKHKKFGLLTAISLDRWSEWPIKRQEKKKWIK